MRLPVFVNYDSAEALDENTLRLHFKKGWLNLPFEFASLWLFFGNFISPLDVEPAWDIKGILKDDKKYNGLGAYYVDENESISKEKIVLKKRNSWMDDLNFHKPKMDSIVLTYIADPQTSVLALEKGEIDYINRYWSPPLDSLPKLEENPKITIATRPDTRIYYIATSWWKEPFNDTDGILLRKAMCYALDRNQMVNGAFLGYAIPATNTIFLSSLWPEFPECCRKSYGYDPEKAKELLNEAGWKDTDGDGILDKDGKSLKDLDLIISSPTTTLVWMDDLALIVQSQLKRIGIDVKIRTLEYSVYSKSRSSGDFDLIFAYTNPRSSPMSRQFSPFNLAATTRTYPEYGSLDDTLGMNADSAQNALDKNERDQHICKICNILYEEAGIIPMVYRMDYAVMSSKVRGFEFGSGWGDDMDNLQECWIED